MNLNYFHVLNGIRLFTASFSALSSLLSIYVKRRPIHVVSAIRECFARTGPQYTHSVLLLASRATSIEHWHHAEHVRIVVELLRLAYRCCWDAKMRPTTNAQHNQHGTCSCIERCAPRMPTANWCLLFHNAKNRGMPIFIRMVAQHFYCRFFRCFFFTQLITFFVLAFSDFSSSSSSTVVCVGFGFNSWPPNSGWASSSLFHEAISWACTLISLAEVRDLS